MRTKVLLLALLCALFSACMTDAGYDPSDKYDDKPIMYRTGRIEGYKCNVYNAYSILPKCTGKLEGYIIYADQYAYNGTKSGVFACIEGYWTYKRDASVRDLRNVPYYADSLYPSYTECDFSTPTTNSYYEDDCTYYDSDDGVCYDSYYSIGRVEDK